MSSSEREQLRPWLRIEPRVVAIPESGCWIFMGATTSRGYGHVGIGRGRTMLAHRASYEFHKGAIPAGLMICHHCDVRCCVNPAHLYAGTHADNTRDTVVRGRAASGMRNGNCRLTPDQVREIKTLLAAGATPKDASLATGVHRRTIKDILSGKNHRHVDVGITAAKEST